MHIMSPLTLLVWPIRLRCFCCVPLQLACSVFAINTACIWLTVPDAPKREAGSSTDETSSPSKDISDDATPSLAGLATARAIWQSLSTEIQRLLAVRTCISWAVMLFRSSVALLLEYQDYGHEIGIQEKGFIISLFSIVGMLAQFLVVPQTSRLASEKRLIAVSAIGMASGGLGVALASTVTSLFVALVVVAISSAILESNFQSVLSKAVRGHGYGAVLGVAGTVDSLARAATPFVTGVLMDVLGPAAPATAASVCALAAAVAARRFVMETPVPPADKVKVT